MKPICIDLQNTSTDKNYKSAIDMIHYKEDEASFDIGEQTLRNNYLRMKVRFFFIIFLASIHVFSQNISSDSLRMKWFNDAKLGIFIHWGIYAVNGTAESWAFYNNEVSYDDYMKQLNGFTASKYNSDEWVKLFKYAGAKYVVLTAKHHDGVALWDTKLSALNVVNKTPAARDLVKPFVNSVRNGGLQVGLYFSHLDWSHADYASMVRNSEIYNEHRNMFAYPPKGKENIYRWESFLKFHRGQIKELCSNFSPDLLWFDGSWEREPEHWRMKDLRDSILYWSPKTILNSRMQGYGDYETPEQYTPFLPQDKKWELCMTINDSWGYRPSDTNFKSAYEIIRTFSECIANGGNLLLDVGPREDGLIPDDQVFVLKQLGEWIRRNEDAVYTTRSGLPLGHYSGYSTISQNKKVIYLFVHDKPDYYIALRGIYNDILSVKVLGTKENLTWKISGGAPWVNIPGLIQIQKPTQYDKYITVVAIEFNNPIKLYRGHGGPIEIN